MVEGVVHDGPGSEPDHDFVSVPVTRLTLGHCDGLVGDLQRIEEHGRKLFVVIHDGLLVYPLGSLEAKTLRRELDGVPVGTYVSVLCLNVKGRERLFVNVDDEGK